MVKDYNDVLDKLIAAKFARAGACVGYREIMEITGYRSKSSLVRILKILERAGKLRIMRDFRGYACDYVITDAVWLPPAWWSNKTSPPENIHDQ